MVQEKGPKRTIFLLLIIFVCLVFLLNGCGSTKNKNSGDANLSVFKLAEKLIKTLGSEKEAALAVLTAWDNGYSLDQIIVAINNESLTEKGKIKGVKPENKPQNFLIGNSRRPFSIVRLSNNKQTSAFLIPKGPFAAEREKSRGTAHRAPTLNSLVSYGVPDRQPLMATANSDDFASEFDKKNIMWTAWLLSIIAKGYSTEQIVDFMLEHDKPAVLIFSEGVGPIITTKKINSKTGKEEEKVVKPASPPKGSPFNPDGKYIGAEEFSADLAKDFEDILDGKGTLRPVDDSEKGNDDSEEGKFRPRSFRIKLELMPTNITKTIRSSDLILRIDADGRATGSYSVELFEKTQNSEITQAEDGTFQGQAVYPKNKGQMIRFDLDGARHIKTSSTTLFDGKTHVTESSLSIAKMFQGVITTDYSKGEGFLYGEAAIYRWRIE